MHASFSAAPALQAAMDTAKMAFAPSSPCNHVQSKETVTLKATLESIPIIQNFKDTRNENNNLDLISCIIQ